MEDGLERQVNTAKAVALFRRRRRVVVSRIVRTLIAVSVVLASIAVVRRRVSTVVLLVASAAERVAVHHGVHHRLALGLVEVFVRDLRVVCGDLKQRWIQRGL